MAALVLLHADGCVWTQPPCDVVRWSDVGLLAQWLELVKVLLSDLLVVECRRQGVVRVRSGGRAEVGLRKDIRHLICIPVGEDHSKSSSKCQRQHPPAVKATRSRINGTSEA
jgi:hypothetical protein